jgi:hypothetical protein
MNYKIAIPSYKRASICNTKTLKMLHDNGIDKNNIFIFVVEDESEEYHSILNRDLYNSIVVGEKGLVQQRNFITNYFDELQHIVYLDDDIETIDLSLSNYENVDKFFTNAFQDCIREHAFIWSIYPVYNPFFRNSKQTITTSLKICIGAFYGVINRKDVSLMPTITINNSNKEDVERTLLFYLKDNKILRYNQIGFKTKYYGTDGGGLGKFKDRLELMKQNTLSIHDAYPSLTKIKIRKNGMYEIILKESHAHRNNEKKAISIQEINSPIFLQEFTESDKFLEIMKRTIVPKHSNRSGRAKSFGEHRSAVFGFIKARITRQYNLSAHSKKFPELYAEIVRIGKLFVPFDFQSIFLNHNVCCPPHKDKNNSGESVIISFGDYEGGELIIEGFGEFVTKNRPLIFNGSHVTHWNNPITSGNKYSLIYFNTKS